MKNVSNVSRSKLWNVIFSNLQLVKSTREGVDEPKGYQTLEIKGPVAWCGDERIPKYSYHLETTNYPFHVEIEEGKTFMLDEGHGSGIGDLWSWSYFSTTSKEEADKYFEMESKRVAKQYPKQLDDYTEMRRIGLSHDQCFEVVEYIEKHYKKNE